MDLAAYSGLFAAAFLAATILPSSSEVVLIGLLASEQFSVPLLLAVASTGNILGAILNWFIGRGVERFRGRKWFPVSESALNRAQAWYGKYGRWSLLLSWVPLIGDALTVAAGVMREKIVPFILLVGFAKTARYVVVAFLFLYADRAISE